MGDAPARRSRRRGDQDRGSVVRGDVGRYVPPFQEGEASLFFETFNRNKRSVSLDLRHPARAASSRISSATADVVYSNLRGDQPAKLRPPLRRPEAREPADRLLLALRVRDDRAAGRRGRLRLHDAGARRLDEPDGRPRRAADEERPLARRPLGRIRVGDRGAGGLWRARRDGVGCDCDISLLETALHELVLRRHVGRVARLRAAARRQLGASVDRPVPELRDRGRLDRRRLPEGEVLAALCDAIGRPELRRRVPVFAERDRRRDELEPILEDVFRARTSAEWLGCSPRPGCRRRR